MRKLLLGVLLGSAILSNAGCIIPIYSPEPTRRMYELLNTSENLREVTNEWQRAWLLDMPTHLTPYRVHGGL